MDLALLVVAIILTVVGWAFIFGRDKPDKEIAALFFCASIVFYSGSHIARNEMKDKTPIITRDAYVIIGKDVVVDGKHFSGTIGVVKTTKDYPNTVMNTETITQIYKGPEFSTDSLIMTY